MDCVPCLVDLVKEARRILKPGGSWVNFGPLKYHGVKKDRLTWDELVELVSSYGFRVLRDEIRTGCLYLPVRRNSLSLSLSLSFVSRGNKTRHISFQVTEGAMDARDGYNCGFFHVILEN